MITACKQLFFLEIIFNQMFSDIVLHFQSFRLLFSQYPAQYRKSLARHFVPILSIV